jgi:hypothetical protein
MIVLGLFVVAIISGITISQSQARNKARAEVFQSLAGRWNGRVDPGGVSYNPRFEIRVDGLPGQITLHTGSKNQSAYTRVHFNWPSRIHLRVAPEGFSTWLRRAIGGGDIQIGEADFDQTFWIETSDPEWAREVLTPVLRRGLLKLRESGGWLSQSNVTLDVGRSGLILGVSRVLVDHRSSLEPFIELAVAALKACRGGGPAVGVVLAAVETKGGSECPVCGHAVDQGITCSTCGTPHHGDCWKYLGGCAIFGCQGRVKSRAG